MKHIKSCAAAVLALLAADAAFADVTVRITGSTAARSVTVAQIRALFTQYDAVTADGSQTGNFATFKGTPVGSLGFTGDLIVQCSWTGSVDGIRDVSNSLTQSFIKASAVTYTVDGNTQVTNLGTTTGSNYEAVVPDITMADNTQAATLYNTNPLLENKVAVVPFVWLKGKVTSFAGSDAANVLGRYNSVTNINTNTIQKILGGGYVPMSYLTGNAGDSSYLIQTLGRNPFSGTRVISFADSGFGTTSTATGQVQTTLGVTVGVDLGNINSIALYPSGTVSGVSVAAGNNGYGGGSALVAAMNANITSATTHYFGGAYTGKVSVIGYSGLGDATAYVTSGGGTALAYNGASLSYDSGNSFWNITNVLNGSYPLWFYEYLSYRPDLAGNVLTFATKLRDNLTALSQSGLASNHALIPLADMQVGREVEGGVIGDPVL